MNKKCIIAGMIGCIGLFSFSFAGNFSDLTSEHWAYNIVNEMHGKGIISGFDDGTFKPNDNVTKEQFAALLFKILQPSQTMQISFNDVTEEYWSKQYVEAIGPYMEFRVENGNCYFEPSSYMKRESVAMALAKALNFDESVANLSLLEKFSDKNNITPEAQKAVALCLENNIMSGNANGTFNPKQYLNRAEISAVLNNVMKSMDQEISAEDINQNETAVTNLNVWNGTYKNGDIKLDLYRSDLDKLTLSISKINGMAVQMSSYDFTLASTDVLTEESDFFDDITKWNIVRTETGVKLNVSSTDSESWLNDASGDYNKVFTEDFGWDGVYQNGDTTIILAQNGTSVYISINKDYSSIGKSCDECSASQIRCEEEFFGEIEKIIIEKNGTGIKVNAMSNESDSILNSINGVYQLVE